MIRLLLDFAFVEESHQLSIHDTIHIAISDEGMSLRKSMCVSVVLISPFLSNNSRRATAKWHKD